VSEASPAGAGHVWDATTYDRVAAPMTRWGADVLARLPLRGDERVLDAGCGTGRVTELLVERLPAGHVVALDASAEMVTEAARRLARYGDRVTVVQADLTEPLPLTRPVASILSTATFHWVMDHDALFRNLAAVLEPGGRLVAQCGGAGNIENVLRVVAGIGDGWRGDFRFETPEATAERLRRAGFVEVETWLTDEPTSFEPGASFEAYLEGVCLRQQVARLPPDERRDFVRAVAARLPEARVDYVRLNIVARRGSSA
jgi:trans-aconitate 2-methyltransferase